MLDFIFPVVLFWYEGVYRGSRFEARPSLNSWRGMLLMLCSLSLKQTKLTTAISHRSICILWNACFRFIGPHNCCIFVKFVINFRNKLQISSPVVRGPLLKGTSRQRSGKGAIRKRFPLQKPRWEKTKLTIRYLYHETIVSRMGSYFPNRWPLSYLNLTKNMKTYIRRQQHKKF